MFTPVKILKVWKRVNDRFGLAEDDPKAKGKEKKVSSKAKQAEKEDIRVDKNLTRLRLIARGDLSEPGTAKKFLKSRDKTAKSMKKYCKLLKSNDLKDSVKDLSKFRKAVKQLVVVVELLEARPYPEEEELGEADLNALEKVDTSQLDQAMEDPNFGEFSDAELEQDEAEETEGEPGVAPLEEKEGGPGSIPPREKQTTTRVDPAAEFKAKLAEWSPAIKTAMAAKGPDAAAIAKLLAQATALSKPGGIITEALAKLTECHKLATAGAGSSVDPAAEFKAKLAEWSPAIKTAMAAKGPDAAAIAKLLAQATALSKPGGDMAQALEKLTEAHKLATAGTAPSTDPAAEFKARMQAFQPTFKTALAEARTNNPELAEELDGLFAQMFDEAKAKKFETALQTLEELTRLVNNLGKTSTEEEEAEEEEVEANEEAETTEEGEAEEGEAEEGEAEEEPVSAAAALAGWQTAREKAVGQLRQLATAIAKTGDPDANKALILLNSVMKNLTPKPENLQSVLELERYINTDDVIQDAEIPNSWGVTVELRKPLGAAVAAMKKSFS